MVISGLEGGKANPNLKVVDMGSKGRGVVTEVKIRKGQYVAEYKTKDIYPT